MDDEDINDDIPNGLDSTSYKTLIDDIHAPDIPIFVHELHEKLINNEISLKPFPLSTANIHQHVITFAANKLPPNRP